jgi:peptidyl-prolyl cis-trans isomerase C
MNYARIFVLASVLTALAACQPKGGATTAAADTSPALATVNGTTITQNFFDFYIKAIAGKKASDLTPEQQSVALDNLIRARLVAQQADKDGVDKTADTQDLLELTRLNVLQQTMEERYLKDKKPTEQELRAEYENQVAALPKLEYHARHILVATEPFAQGVVQSLEKGAKFEDVAKKESMDSSKDNGGDLGWFTPDRMVKPFADAVTSLKPGDYTHKPIQTQYGWHVIQLVDTRPLSPPPFDQVKQRLEQVVQAKKFKAYTDDLISKAKIDRTSAAPAAPAAVTPPAPKAS